MCFIVHVAAESETQPLFGSLWLFYVKMAGTANSYNLEIPDGKKRLSFSKKKILECNSK